MARLGFRWRALRNHKGYQRFCKVSPGAAPRQQGRRRPPQEPSGAALGDEKACRWINRLSTCMLFASFSDAFWPFLAGRPCPSGPPPGMYFRTVSLMVAHGAALRLYHVATRQWYRPEGCGLACTWGVFLFTRIWDGFTCMGSCVSIQLALHESELIPGKSSVVIWETLAHAMYIRMQVCVLFHEIVNHGRRRGHVFCLYRGAGVVLRRQPVALPHKASRTPTRPSSGTPLSD